MAYKWAAKLLETARQHRETILAGIGPQSEKANYITAVYGAVEAVLGGIVPGTDLTIQMLILTTFAEQKKEIAAIFDSNGDVETRAKINTTVGYTLLYALVSGKGDVSRSAADCLAKTADMRMENVLKAVVEDQGEKPAGKRAAWVLDRIETSRGLSVALPHLKPPADVRIEHGRQRVVFRIQ